MRHRSIAGPLVLIAVGTLFLLRDYLPNFSVTDVLFQYWPFLLILLGIVKLVEVLVAAGNGKLVETRRFRGGFGVPWILLGILMVFLSAVHRNRPNFPVMAFTRNGFELFQQDYEYPVTEQGDAKGIRTVVFDNISGSLTLTGTTNTDTYSAEGNKTVQAYRKEDADEADHQTHVQFVREGDQLVVRLADEQRQHARRITANLEIKVPRTVGVETRGRSGDLTINSLEGAVSVASERGEIRLNELAGDVRVEMTRCNLLRATDLKGTLALEGRGNDIQLENIAGQVTVNGSYGGTLEFKNLAQPLHFESNQTDLRVAKVPGTLTMSLGDLRADNIVGPVHLRTSKSRDIRLNHFSDALELEIERGDIELNPDKLPLGKMDVRSRNGNIELALPAKAEFDLKANTDRGEAHNDYGPEVRMDVEGRAASLRSVQGNSGPPITLATARGTVSVRKN